MEHGFSVLMLIFGIAILLYAGLVTVCGYSVIPRGYAAKPKNKRVYAKQFAKLLLLVAAAPLVSALVGLWHWIPALIMLVILGIVCICGGMKLTHFAELTVDSEERERDE